MMEVRTYKFLEQKCPHKGYDWRPKRESPRAEMVFIRCMKTKTRKSSSRNVLHKGYEDQNEKVLEQKWSSLGV
ncbi:hypothetical protein J2S19_000886 [Metabacillus malikii]|uniref:Uncharacterized protein n=1 Tax=Metabacillus malikii TaxID=1504265 RepID=A0ABT9ZBK6_9BACI|nr:hypothetical protein [Metabacillus malikii]